MALPLLVAGEEPITFREVQQGDRERLVEMHEELFPVSYSKLFYDKAVQKTGLRGGSLFTSIAFQQRDGVDVMVGFVMSQFLPITNCDERGELFSDFGEPEYVYYILTLGVEKGMRRTGLGSELLRQCIADATLEPKCGAVYLHVISYNIPALRFYMKNGFSSITEFPGFYKIHNRSYASELCSLYINGYKPPFFMRMHGFISSHVNNMFQWVKNIFHTDSSEIISKKTVELYMDDIELPSDENQLMSPTRKSKIVPLTPPNANDIPAGQSIKYSSTDSDDYMTHCSGFNSPEAIIHAV